MKYLYAALLLATHPVAAEVMFWCPTVPTRVYKEAVPGLACYETDENFNQDTYVKRGQVMAVDAAKDAEMKAKQARASACRSLYVDIDKATSVPELREIVKCLAGE